MKSITPRKKSMSDFSSQDELSLKRVIKGDTVTSKRPKKPSIYDEMDDEFMDQHDDDDFDIDEEEDDDDYIEDDDGEDDE